MPYPTTITPYGTRIATPARGHMMGNRGILHNDNLEVVREFRGTRWICCELKFKGREKTQRAMTPGLYTRLFFLDEATALAAGHRPCAECRRPAYDAFLEAWTRVRGGKWTATTMDAILHTERLAGPYKGPVNDLPDGSMIELSGKPYLVRGDLLLEWTPFGYAAGIERPRGVDVRILTPASIVDTLNAGYTATCGEFPTSQL